MDGHWHRGLYHEVVFKIAFIPFGFYLQKVLLPKSRVCMK